MLELGNALADHHAYYVSADMKRTLGLWFELQNRVTKLILPGFGKLRLCFNVNGCTSLPLPPRVSLLKFAPAYACGLS
jgi:hypothetical protein